MAELTELEKLLKVADAWSCHMPLKTKILTVPERFQPKLREHNFKHAESWKEKIDVLGRDEKGRIKPLVPKPDEPASE